MCNIGLQLCSLFPEALSFAPFSATLLRLILGISVLGIAYAHYNRREELARARYPMLGSPGSFLMWLVIGIETVLGIGLIVGIATQALALGTLALSIKHGIYAKSYPRAIPLCRGEYILLAVISISLFLTGAGAIAFDLPL